MKEEEEEEVKVKEEEEKEVEVKEEEKKVEEVKKGVEEEETSTTIHSSVLTQKLARYLKNTFSKQSTMSNPWYDILT